MGAGTSHIYKTASEGDFASFPESLKGAEIAAVELCLVTARVKCLRWDQP